MALNQALAEHLNEIAEMMELLGEDSFRAAANARAARLVEGMPGAVEDVAKDRGALLAIKGIGEKLADKIVEFCEKGGTAEHEGLRAKVPPGLLEVLRVPGLGPKTVRAMWQVLGVTDVASLERAIGDGSLLALPRMGEKAVEKIRASLAVVKGGQERLRLGPAAALAERFIGHIRGHAGVGEVCVAGSLRRGRETVGDLDILAMAGHGHEGRCADIVQHFTAGPGVVQVLAAGETKGSVRVTLSHDTGRWKQEGHDERVPAGPSIQVDLRVVPRESWGSALLYFTGSKEHNVRLRERALAQGMTLNEWGLYPEDGGNAPPQTRGVRAKASRTEEEVYAALGLAWIPPEVREDRGEFERRAWDLVELKDIRAELHAHTTASDGSMSIAELVGRAQDRGFHTIAVTDHSQSSTIARGLRPDRLRRHIGEVREVGEKVKGIRVLAGSEVDILADGRLDYEDELLAELDVVVASPHAALSQDSVTCTRRLLKAVEHPLVHILGHPTGRLINRRKGLEPDMACLIAAAVEHDVALEINAHWMRLDLRDTHVRLAVEAGAKIAINCDVHAPEDFDNLRFGVLTGRRGWLSAGACVNTWDARKLSHWLGKKRPGKHGGAHR